MFRWWGDVGIHEAWEFAAEAAKVATERTVPQPEIVFDCQVSLANLRILEVGIEITPQLGGVTGLPPGLVAITLGKAWRSNVSWLEA